MLPKVICTQGAGDSITKSSRRAKRICTEFNDRQNGILRIVVAKKFRPVLDLFEKLIAQAVRK